MNARDVAFVGLWCLWLIYRAELVCLLDEPYIWPLISISRQVDSSIKMTFEVRHSPILAYIDQFLFFNRIEAHNHVLLCYHNPFFLGVQKADL